MADAYVSILGDLHGHITLAYRLLKRWEVEENMTLSAIFQVGDFGAFPPPFKADRETMRFYQKDPDELSFVDYYKGSKEAEEILGDKASPDRRIAANLYFIKGNHEDFEYLDGLPEFSDFPASVDTYQKIHYLASGRVYNLSIGQRQIQVAALGGVSRDNHWGEAAVSECYTRSEYRNLCSEGHNSDIFLSHDVPYGSFWDDAGSIEVRDFIETYQPALHFCGHYHVDGQQLQVPGSTRSYILNEVNFRKPSRLNAGCISVVRIGDNGAYEVSILNENWMREYRRDDFRGI